MNFFVLFKEKMYKVINCFRIFPFKLLKQAAVNTMKEAREKPVEVEHTFLVKHVPKVWGSANPVNKEAVTHGMAGVKRKDFKFWERDEKLMDKFLDHTVKSKMVFPDLIETDSMFPTEVPLLDLLIGYKSNTVTWDYPSPGLLAEWSAERSITWGDLNKVEWRELVIGDTTPARIKEFSDWVNKKHSEDQKKFPTGVISFDVEMIRITRWDLEMLTWPENQGKYITMSADPYSASPEDAEKLKDVEDKWFNLPAKCMFGNGTSWLGLISFDIRKRGKKYAIAARGINPEIVQLLRELPPCTGVGISEDVKLVQSVFSILTKEEVKMKPPVDLESLAVLAGWRLEARNMTALSMISCGTIMNKISSCADNKWGLRFKEIPKSLQIYANGDIKAGFLMYNTLISCLLLDTFPDPESLCHLMDSMQRETVEWFNTFVRHALRGTRVYTKAVENATTRAELMAAIRAPTPAGKISTTVPKRVKVFSMLNSGHPALWAGGPRYLHWAREESLRQYTLLRKTKHFKYQHLFKRVITAEDRAHVRFEVLDIKDLDVTLPPHKREPKIGLVVHKDLRKKKFVLPEEINNSTFVAEAKRINRYQKPSVLEWVYLNVTEVEKLFEAFNRDEFFSIAHKHYYERARLITKRLRDISPVRVNACEEMVKRTQEDCLKWAEKHHEWLIAELKWSENYMPRLKEERSKQRNTDRTRARRELLERKQMAPKPDPEELLDEIEKLKLRIVQRQAQATQQNQRQNRRQHRDQRPQERREGNDRDGGHVEEDQRPQVQREDENRDRRDTRRAQQHYDHHQQRDHYYQEDYDSYPESRQRRGEEWNADDDYWMRDENEDDWNRDDAYWQRDEYNDDWRRNQDDWRHAEDYERRTRPPRGEGRRRHSPPLDDQHYEDHRDRDERQHHQDDNYWTAPAPNRRRTPPQQRLGYRERSRSRTRGRSVQRRRHPDRSQSGTRYCGAQYPKGSIKYRFGDAERSRSRSRSQRRRSRRSRSRTPATPARRRRSPSPWGSSATYGRGMSARSGPNRGPSRSARDRELDHEEELIIEEMEFSDDPEAEPVAGPSGYRSNPPPAAVYYGGPMSARQRFAMDVDEY